MRLWSTVECLVYLLIFLLYLKISECGSIDLIQPSTSATLTADTLTTTERSLEKRKEKMVREREQEEEEGINSSRTLANRLKYTLKECQNSLSWMCLKLELIQLLENLTNRNELRLINGISLVKDAGANEIKTADLMAEVARSYPNDPSARLNGYIINKVYNVLQTHYLRFKLIDDQILEQARSMVETGRRDKFGKKGGMEALMAAGLMMKGTLMAMGMGGIILVAGKALITALMALTLAAVVGLKSLVSGGGKSHTYEIVTKPIYTSSHSHSVSHDEGGHGAHIGLSGSGYGGYARTLNLNLPQSVKGN